MAIVIDSFAPEFGLTIGGTLVVIEGSGFAPLVPIEVAPGEITPAPLPAVRAMFGTLEGRIIAQSETRLIVLTPRIEVETMLALGALDPDTKTPTATADVSLTVENLDEDGDVIEAVEAEDPWMYRLIQTSDTTVLAAVTRRVINSLRAWLHPRIYHKPHPDYALAELSDGEVEVWVFNRAQAPAFALVGPGLTPDTFATRHVLPSEPGLGDFVRGREPYYDTLTYQLLGFATTPQELLTMQDSALRVFRDWKSIPHPSGEGDIDIDLVEHPRPNPTPNNSGLLSFTVEFTLASVPVGLAPERFANDLLLEWSAEVDAPQFVFAQMGDPLALTPDPGVPLELTLPPADARPTLRFPRFSRPPTIAS